MKQGNFWSLFCSACATLLLLLAFSACEKGAQEELVSPFPEKVHKLRAMLLQLPVEEQREKFGSLHAEEMAAVWQDKMEQAIALEGWDPAQRKHLQILKGRISPELFVDGTAEAIDFRQNFEPAWRSKGKSIFPIPLLQKVVTSLENIDPRSINSRIIVEAGEPADDVECSCSETSDWCWDPQNCTGRCYVGSRHGCGTVWAYACDGVCVR